MLPVELVAVAVEEAEAAELATELATTATLEALRKDEAETGVPVATPIAVEEGRTVDVAAGADDSPERADTAAVAAVKAELSVDRLAQGILVRNGCSRARKRQVRIDR